MTVLLQCRQLSQAAGNRSLFDGLDLAINHDDRLGLVGHNGCGKSTLLRMLAAQAEPDSGDIVRAGDLAIEFVEQFLPPGLGDKTLFEGVLEKLPAEEQDWRGYEVEKLLAQLDFTLDMFGFSVDALSGGQQNRLMFARAVITQPSLILFDEPTNHLDLRTLMLFEQFLLDLNCAYVLVSHDRQFLDTVTEKTVFLRDGRAHSFDLAFSDARTELLAMDAAASHSREQEEKVIEQLTASAKRLAMWGKVYDNEKLAKKAKTIARRVEKLEEEKTFVTRGNPLNLALDVGKSRSARLLTLEDLDVRYEATPLFHVNEFFIRPGDRVALLGHNGAGKSTLIRSLVDTFDAGSAGAIRFSPQCRLGYYDQELERLDPSRTLMETLRDLCPGQDQDHTNALITPDSPTATTSRRWVSCLGVSEHDCCSSSSDSMRPTS